MSSPMFRLWHHPESDAYFYAVPGEWQAGADGSLCNDVSDSDFHIEQSILRGTTVSDIKQHEYADPALMAMSRLVADHMKRATKCCPNCAGFNIKKELCEKVNNMRPPAHIIAFGCNFFEENGVPF